MELFITPQIIYFFATRGIACFPLLLCLHGFTLKIVNQILIFLHFYT